MDSDFIKRFLNAPDGIIPIVDYTIEKRDQEGHIVESITYPTVYSPSNDPLLLQAQQEIFRRFQHSAAEDFEVYEKTHCHRKAIVALAGAIIHQDPLDQLTQNVDHLTQEIHTLRENSQNTSGDVGAHISYDMHSIPSSLKYDAFESLIPVLEQDAQGYSCTVTMRKGYAQLTDAGKRVLELERSGNVTR